MKNLIIKPLLLTLSAFTVFFSACEKDTEPFNEQGKEEFEKPTIDVETNFEDPGKVKIYWETVLWVKIDHEPQDSLVTIFTLNDELLPTYYTDSLFFYSD